jgi:lipopolysaccharide transport system ATP-binding protein
VERFIDTPVKHYSSGMHMRLAFAVAAHLEPEILIVDEVLAVGDATYQRRCIDRMAHVARSGTTVLFVSHNMDLIPRLCNRALLLRGGRVQAAGPADRVTREYMQADGDARDRADLTAARRAGNGRAVFESLEVVGPDGCPTRIHVSGDDLSLSMTVVASEAVEDVAAAVVLENLYGTRIITSWTREAGYHLNLRPGRQVIRCRFRRVDVRPGHRLRVGLWLATQEVLDAVDDAGIIEVVASDATEAFSTDQMQGIVLCRHEWSYEAP